MMYRLNNGPAISILVAEQAAESFKTESFSEPEMEPLHASMSREG